MRQNMKEKGNREKDSINIFFFLENIAYFWEDNIDER